MYWIQYLALLINLIIIWFMPKHLTKAEIYTSWGIIALINLSTDLILNFVFSCYDLGPPGPQLAVHGIELTLSPSYGVFILNFMPERMSRFLLYAAFWVAYSTIFEAVSVTLHFINYIHWRLWYSMLYYFFTMAFLRWHLHFIPWIPGDS